MFLAPCTLPLVPAFIAYISGIKPSETRVKSQRKIILNSLFYVLGFSVVFITFGVLAGLAGVFASSLRQVLVPLAGVLVIIFGLQLLHIVSVDKIFSKSPNKIPDSVKPGTPFSSFIIGAAFAIGWTPCVGPILATVLLLAGSSATVFSGGILLAIFALGLAIPFMLTAFLYSHATHFITKYAFIVKITEVIGGVLLLTIGVLLLTNNFELTILYGYKLLESVGIGNLLDYY